MKVIDKRTKNRDEQWHAGDVICYWNNDDDTKLYGQITHNTYGYNEADLNDNPGNVYNTAFTNLDNLMKQIANNWDHVEKVNAHLVVED
ncbi:hypothetical protein [uncultured Lactobacillus sp.]|uniref:hypothetical protein n=1 Tax=uncultured Lactobacillus sp. TaxID=153152 RepID=UPI00263921F7|nr:hypothetical protein [uncultured Lactobacillus sp.]